ncbi:hypothetical protein JAAARDRAFT_62356 [Jaapia argillacea MUCL 33604]|uniref:Uncharacterized protein n=1 Tax=Jaapia argillacea MUCL 33604 TaxID=933084 RepID=A0A067PA64_9AGAM|nr:hypothetical protein JAAARDRAFT_62356 [Jaapia argillacea MUCL 33604]
MDPDLQPIAALFLLCLPFALIAVPPLPSDPPQQPTPTTNNITKLPLHTKFALDVRDARQLMNSDGDIKLGVFREEVMQMGSQGLGCGGGRVGGCWRDGWRWSAVRIGRGKGDMSVTGGGRRRSVHAGIRSGRFGWHV